MLVDDVRNLWQFSALCEFVTLFGEALRIPELDIDSLEQQLALETEDGQYLRDVRLSLLKALSSNRNINHENMDEYIRRQYTYRRIYPNPLLKVERVWKELSGGEGDDDQDSDLGDVEEVEQQTLISWLELSVPQRVGVLHDLCEWQLHSEKFRERVGGTTELQATQWRIEPAGSDAQQQIYYLLSSGRLFTCNDPATQYERNTKKRKRNDDDTLHVARTTYQDGWTCVAAAYDQWQTFIADLSKTRNADERQLLKYLREVALPYVEDVEQAKRAEAARKQALAEKLEAERVKEMMRQEMLSSRKRSSRIQMLDERKEAERERAEQLRKEQELQEKARVMAIKEAAGQGPPQPPKTREARLRNRELREALSQMQRRNGINGSHYDASGEASMVNSGAQTPTMDNSHQKGEDRLDSIGTLPTTTEGSSPFSNKITMNPPAEHNYLAQSDTSLQQDQQQQQQPAKSDPYAKGPQDHEYHDQKEVDIQRANSALVEIPRGTTVPHEHIGSIKQMNGSAGRMQISSTDTNGDAFNRVGASANDTYTNGVSDTSAPQKVQVSEADVSWVQKQADRLAGSQAVAQESTVDTASRMAEQS